MLVRGAHRGQPVPVLERDGGPERVVRRARGRAVPVVVGVGALVWTRVEAAVVVAVGEDGVDRARGQLGGVPVLVLVVVVGVAGAQGLHLGLLALDQGLGAAVLQRLQGLPTHRHLGAQDRGF